MPWQPSAAPETAADVVTVPGTCNSVGLNSCVNGLTSCVIANSSDPAGACWCHGHFDHCLASLNCPNATVAAAVASCKEAGCSTSQCNPNNYNSSESAPPLGICNYASLQICGLQLSSCAASHPADVCSCRGTYDKCVQGHGCPADVVSAVVKACEDAGCTAAQCAASESAAPAATSESSSVKVPDVPALLALVGDSPVLGMCDYSNLHTCSMTLSSCVDNHPDNLCMCRGSYDACVKGVGCPDTVVQSVVTACEEAGCTPAQCTPADLGVCNYASLQTCALTLSSCVMNHPTDTCPCRGAYDTCVKGIGCSDALVQQVVHSCEEVGCSAAQCTPQ